MRLERKQVRRLFDDADGRVVASRVRADAAQLRLREVPHSAQRPNAFLHVLDRARERERLVLRSRKEMEGEPLRRPLPDSGQLRELRDEIVHGR